MKKAPFPWIIHHIRRRIPALVLLTLVSTANAVLMVLFALGSRSVIDSAVSADAALFRDAAICQGAVILGILVTLILHRHVRDQLLADLDRDWKKLLLGKLLHSEYPAVSGYHSAELLNRLNNDVARVNEGVVSLVPGLLAMLTRLATAAAVLIRLDPLFTALIAALGLAVVVVTGTVRGKLRALNKQVSTHDGKVSALLQELMEKLLMVQAMDVAPEAQRRSDELLEERWRVQRKRKNAALLANAGMSMVAYGANFFTLVWCAAGLLHGSMTFGALTAMIQLVGQLQAPFVNLSASVPKYIAMTASAERLMELEQLPRESDRGGEDPASLYARMTAVCGEGITFRYDRANVLENASFRLEKGSFTVITGTSGNGKSTLLKLLLGIYTPESGSLTAELGEKTVPLDRSTRGLFAYVPQGNLLLSGTLRENLMIVRPDATGEELTQALYVSCMDEFVNQLPNGLDTDLGENGAGLSEGQAQRLAIARAVLGGAPVLLLDECTSALDAATEERVLQRIAALPGRTTVAVTHRDAARNFATSRWNLSGSTVTEETV